MTLIERRLKQLEDLARANGRVVCSPMFPDGNYMTVDYPQGTDNFTGTLDQCIAWEKGYSSMTGRKRKGRKK